jgi:hypothetical protein
MCPNGQRCVACGSKEGGFSLLEVLVALGLSLVVVSAIVAFQRYQLTALGAQARQVDLQGTARSVVDLVAREVRQTGRNPKCQAAVGGLASASKGGLRLQTDLSGDGQVTDDNEDISYQLDEASQSVVRINHAKNQTDTLIEGIDINGSGFQYFDGGGNELGGSETGGLDAGQRAKVRRARFDLVMVDTRSNRGTLPPRVRASTNLDLRNRFFVAVNSACTPTVAQPTVPPPQSPRPTATCASPGGVCVDDVQCCKPKHCKRDSNVADPNYYCG